MNIDLLFEVAIYGIYIMPYYEGDIGKLQEDIIVFLHLWLCEAFLWLGIIHL